MCDNENNIKNVSHTLKLHTDLHKIIIFPHFRGTYARMCNQTDDFHTQGSHWPVNHMNLKKKF